MLYLILFTHAARIISDQCVPVLKRYKDWNTCPPDLFCSLFISCCVVSSIGLTAPSLFFPVVFCGALIVLVSLPFSSGNLVDSPITSSPLLFCVMVTCTMNVLPLCVTAQCVGHSRMYCIELIQALPTIICTRSVMRSAHSKN